MRRIHLPEALRRAAEAGDVAATEAALGQLAPGEVPLEDLFAFTGRLAAQPATAFVLLHHVAMQEPPAARTEWLRALNNACAFAVTHGTPAQREALAERGLDHGSENPPIFHNAACVFCALGMADEALACVEGAVLHGYEHLDKLVDDPDLDLVRTRPDFLALVGREAETQRQVRAEDLAELSAALFGGEPVPDDLAALWVEEWSSTGFERPATVDVLLEERPSHFGRLDALLEHPEVGPAYRAALAQLDFFAEHADELTFLAYDRGPGRRRPLAESPVVEVRESGAIRVCARTLFEHLAIAAHDAAHGPLAFSRGKADAEARAQIDALHVVMRNAGVTVADPDVPAARAYAAALTPHPLDGVADALAGLSSGPSATLRALAEGCKQVATRADGSTRRAVLVELSLRPWRSGSLSRAGGPGVGVPPDKVAGNFQPWTHLFTLERAAVPALAQVSSGGAAHDSLALAVFVEATHLDDGPGFATVQYAAHTAKACAVTKKTVAKYGEQLGRGGERAAELPRAVPVCVEVDVPEALLGSPALWQNIRVSVPAGRTDTHDTRFLLWAATDGSLGLQRVPLPRPAEETFFEALQRSYAGAGFALALPRDDAGATFSAWMKALEEEVEDGPPDHSPGGLRERYDPDAAPDRVALHHAVLAPWFRPVVGMLCDLLWHPAAEVRVKTALTVADLFRDASGYEMYSESVGEKFRALVGEHLAKAVDPVQLVRVLLAGFPPVDPWARGTPDPEVPAALVEVLRTVPVTAALCEEVVAFGLNRLPGGDVQAPVWLAEVADVVKNQDGIDLAPLVGARFEAYVARGERAIPEGAPEPELLPVLRAFARLGESRAIDALRSALSRAESAGERTEIVTLLESRQVREAVPNLLAQLEVETDPSARAALLRALTLLGDAEVQRKVRAAVLADSAAVMHLVHVPEEPIREAAIEAARGGSAEARAFLVEMQTRGWTYVTLVRALGELGATEAVPGLLAQARAPEGYNSQPALEALAELGDPRAFDVLFAALRQRSDEFIVGAGARGMAQMFAGRAEVPELPQVIDALLAVVNEVKYHGVEEALDALGRLGATRALPAVLARVRSDHGGITRWAALVVQELDPGSSEGVGVLLEQLRYAVKERARGFADARTLERLDRLAAALARAPDTEAARKLRAALVG